MTGISIHEAAAIGKVGLVKAFVQEKSVPPDTLNDTGHTALFMACYAGYSKMVKVLLNAGADINLRCGPDLVTPVYVAAIRGHLGLVRELVELGADLSIFDKLGSPVLHAMVELGHVEAVRQLLQMPGVDVNMVDKHGHSALILGSRHHFPQGHARIDEVQHAELVRILCEAGADTEATVGGQQEATPLILAAEAGHVLVVRELLRRGASTAATGFDGVTPLLAAAQTGDVDVVKELLEAGADKEAKSTKGFTSLMLASKRGHVEVIRVLLDAGTTTEAICRDGLTAIAIAVLDSQLGVLRELLKAGAVTTQPLGSQRTPLMLVAQTGNVAVLNELLSAGADVMESTSEGFTPLTMAVQKKHAKMVRALLAAGVDPSAAPWIGENPLFTAVRANSVEITRDLLRWGANPTETESRIGFYTPLHYAADLVYPEVVEALLSAGALETALDVNGDMPSCVIGLIDYRHSGVDMDPRKKAFMQRLIERGPAFRARSWLWPLDATGGRAGQEATGLSAAAGSGRGTDVIQCVYKADSRKKPCLMLVRAWVERRSKRSSRPKIAAALYRYATMKPAAVKRTVCSGRCGNINHH